MRAKEAGFLAGIEMELDRGGGLEVGVDQCTEDLDSIDGAGPILTRRNEVSITVIKCDIEITYIVSAWGASCLWRVQVDRVLVCTEDRDGSGGGTVYPGNHGELDPRVHEPFDSDSRLS